MKIRLIILALLLLTVSPVHAGDYRERDRDEYRLRDRGKYEREPSGDYYVVPKWERYRRLEPSYQRTEPLRRKRSDHRHDRDYGEGKRHGHGGRGRR